ncbi:MAG TPA: tetratricopeptide repeat protein [Candidatus Acidoferrales bacterium]|jgi:tetratricopeptide (TPR) repeat protein|nr:tetratricopeptide repeat protein [Candidatus Acidoferrales bacterium]
MRKYFSATALILAGLVWASIAARPGAAQAAQSAQPTYTMQEYNSFQACQAEKDPVSKMNCLDGFITKYPNSTLIKYIGQVYMQVCNQYAQAKDYAHAISCADRVLGLGDKMDVTVQLQAIQLRIQAFSASFNASAPDATAQLTKERDDAALAVQLLPKLPKPENVADEQFDAQKKQIAAFFNTAIAAADFQMKDYPNAITAYKTVLANTPNDALAEYRLGLAYMALTPPQPLDGMWAVARAIDLKIPDADKVKDYLRKTMINYEQPTCDTLIDGQLNEMLQLAQNSPDRPATYTIPASADLLKIAQSSTIVTVLQDLSGGGDKAKMTWLAICGAEFPEVVGKIIDVQKSDAYVDFMVYFGATQADVEAATTANMDVKVWTAPNPAATAGAASDIPPQPDVVRLEKDDPIRFSGTLVAYDPSPFMLHWDKVKVDPTIIPEKGKAPAHRK